ncbi:NAD(P)H-dependent oxidoreductase [Paracraurococcus lichenis]|uniref:NAD(P)H-dependent oxidoreductase n=1 Tax=Paracraurococcus lichenis TaxID=3064888 RepID=A0ABT9DUE5_9PROT|nr:NAD(P)H-dependent oxidoreductase [Paracraurococcus sp. LOR1-02]MDO9707525.1 NAD(P)H-dependent oxidoreductase [Paracraurococcus sp. LOR1-02]
MTETLILLSHPDYGASRANRALAAAAAGLPGVAVAHLEALYPDGRIDVPAEVARLLAARRIVLQFPVQWYATPPLLKAWQDGVLTPMFYVAPETEGAVIAGRPLLVAATAGNRRETYGPGGVNLYPLAELLRPLQATASRCALAWQEPFLVHDARSAGDAALAAAGRAYAARLAALPAG